jgi:acyl-CoA thioester hydrolase
MAAPLSAWAPKSSIEERARFSAKQVRPSMTQDNSGFAHPSLLQTPTEVKPEWIDRNNHMNNAYYLLVSQPAYLAAVRAWRGGAPDDRDTYGNFVTQSAVTYIHEVRAGIRLVIASRLIAVDDKRMHIYAELFDADKSRLLAITERTAINIKRGRPPRVTPYPEDVLASLQQVHAAQAEVPFAEDYEPTLSIQRRKRRAAARETP